MCARFLRHRPRAILLLVCAAAFLCSPVWAASDTYIIAPPLSDEPLVILPPLLTPMTLSPSGCPGLYPPPKVELIGTESYTVSGKKFVRYLLSVKNRWSYPDSLFAPAPSLPPCGLNTNASRTWVYIVDQDDNYIYGFCALGSAEDLDGLWFAVEVGETPPAGVYVVLWDRLCQKDWTDGYRSGLVPIEESMFSPPPATDLEIYSMWTATPPVIDGNAGAAEWAGAGTLPIFDTRGIQRGNLFVKNDNEALYFLLDMTLDPTAGPQANDDYSALPFDIGLDGFKSPYVDLAYVTAAGKEILGIQWAVSASGWTGVYPTALSHYREGYGPSPGSSKAHKLYEYKIAFEEIGIDFAAVLSDPDNLYQARFSVRVVSEDPAFAVHYPSSQYAPFNNPMIRLALGLPGMSVDPGAPIISGIGLVPRTFIDQTTGLATTGAGHQVNVTDAPFGGHLRVIGNLPKLRGMGIKNYAIGYCDMDLHPCDDLGSGAFNLNHWKFVEDVRANYYWDALQGRFVLEKTSPFDIFSIPGIILKAYPVPSGALQWYLPNLLFDWRTTGSVPVNSGLYKIHFFGFAGNTIGSLMMTPAAESTLVVRIDNTPPVMRINSISYKGSEIDACEILRLDNVNDDLVVNVSAYDPDGFLFNFNLSALYGNNQSFNCYREDYDDFLAGGGTAPLWFGAMPSADFICEGDGGDHWETSCGYTFQVSGWDRAINGYGRIHRRSGHQTITILLPGFALR